MLNNKIDNHTWFPYIRLNNSCDYGLLIYCILILLFYYF